MNCQTHNNWGRWAIGSVAFTVALAVCATFYARDHAPPALPAGHAVATAVQPQSVPIRPAGGKTLADASARLELAGAFVRSSRDLVLDVLPDVYDVSEWHDVSPFSRQTGKAQKGWVAKDMLTAMDYESNPNGFDGGLNNNAHQLSIFPEDGVLNAQINITGGLIVDYQYDAVDSPMVVMNVVFDLPSNHHKYMKMVGMPGSSGGVIISPMNAPELLAQVMTSTYMHIYIPMIGQAEPVELMFYNEPFKALLAPADRAVATVATEKADRDAMQGGH